MNLAIGKPINRFGLSFKSYYFENFVQVNAGISLYRNFSSLGPKNTSNEIKASLGVIGAFGENRNYSREAFLNPVGNQTDKLNSVGYAYTIYLDNNKTGQSTGMIGMNFKGFFLVHENDILVGTGNDKFRTGGLLISYEYEKYRFGINYMGWTGDPRSDGVKKVKDSNYPSKKGYKDLSEGFLGKFSNGVLALQAETILDYGQVVRIQGGIDAEQVRHVMQNKLMHEWITGGYQYPMLMENGEPYLFEEDQKIRAAKPYFELMLNPNLFY